jgi:ribosome-binding protein aMBF1 (putative translation factor)
MGTGNNPNFDRGNTIVCQYYNNRGELEEIRIYKNEYLFTTLSGLLQKARKEKNLSIEELSITTNIPKEIIKEIEQNLLSVPIGTLNKVLEVLGVNIKIEIDI